MNILMLSFQFVNILTRLNRQQVFFFFFLKCFGSLVYSFSSYKVRVATLDPGKKSRYSILGIKGLTGRRKCSRSNQNLRRNLWRSTSLSQFRKYRFFKLRGQKRKQGIFSRSYIMLQMIFANSNCLHKRRNLFTFHRRTKIRASREPNSVCQIRYLQ